MIDCLQSPIPNVTYGPKIAPEYDARNRDGGGAGTRLFPLTQERAKARGAAGRQI
jgi:hypothetical protein